MKRFVLLAALLGIVAQGAAADDQPAKAKVTVKLPAAAKLYVNDTLTPYTGASRTITTPSALQPGKTYHYTLRATIVRNGKTASATKKVDLQAGDSKVVDFGELRGGTASKSIDPEKGPALTSAAPSNDPFDDPAKALGLPGGAAPQIRPVHIAGEQLVVRLMELVPTSETRTATKKTPDGKEVAYQYTITVMKTQSRLMQMNLKALDITDATGAPVAADTASMLLKKETLVLLAHDSAKPDPRYLAAFKPDTLVLVPKVGMPLYAPSPNDGESTKRPTFTDHNSLALATFDEAEKKTDAPRPAAPQPVPANAPPRAQPPEGQLPLGTQPPELRLARIDASGELRLCDSRTMDNSYAAKKEVRVGNEVKYVEVQFRGSSYSLTSNRVAPGGFKATSSDGKPFAPAALRKALTPFGVALASFDGKATDPGYLQIVRSTTPVLTVDCPNTCGYGGYYGGHAMPAQVPEVVPQPQPAPPPTPKKSAPQLDKAPTAG